LSRRTAAGDPAADIVMPLTSRSTAAEFVETTNSNEVRKVAQID
jgi:hypothetical protein